MTDALVTEVDSASEQSRGGSQSPPPVRRSKQYEDLLLKQLRKTSRQLCLETAYACDRQSTHYCKCTLELTHQRHDSIVCCSSLFSNGGGVQDSSQATSGLVNRHPLKMDQREIGSYRKSDPRMVQQNDSRDCSPYMATALHSTTSLERNEVPAITSARLLNGSSRQEFELNFGQFNGQQLKPTTADSCNSSSVTDKRSSVIRQQPSCPDFSRPNTEYPGFQNANLLKLSSASEIAATVHLPEHERSRDQLYKQRGLSIGDAKDAYLVHRCPAPARGEEILARTLNHMQVEDEQTSVIVERELRVTEVLRHCTKLDGGFPADAKMSCEQTDGDTSAARHSSCDEGNGADGSDSETGIEAYHPDNPSVLRKKIEDLESQIQDLQEANVATYEEVLRLQKENCELKEQSSRVHTASRASSRSRLHSAADDEANFPDSRSEPSGETGTSSSRSRLRSNASSSSSRTDRLTSSGLMKERDAVGAIEPPTTLTPDHHKVWAGEGEGRAAARDSDGEHRARWEDTGPRELQYLRPKRLTYDDDADDEVDDGSVGLARQFAGEATASWKSHDCILANSPARSAGHERTWRTSSSFKPGAGLARSPGGLRTLVPRTLADISLGDAIKFTKPDGRVGRGTVSYVGWCNEKREMCVGVMDPPSENCSALPVPADSGPGAWLRKDVIVPFQKVLLVWKKAVGCG